MRTSTMRTTIFALGLLAVFSCAQDPIFYRISTEPPPQNPLIRGAPTNMVEFGREYPNPDYDPDPGNTEDPTVTVPILYVASGRLHWYAKTELGTGVSGWDSKEYLIEQPEGKIIALAATSKYLYALSLPGHGIDTVLKFIGKDSTSTEWEEVRFSGANYPQIQSIYADPSQDRVFAGARTSIGDRDDYAILYLDTDDTLKLLKGETTLLSGAVFDGTSHYLSTTGNGIFQISETDLNSPNFDSAAHVSQQNDATPSDNKDRMFMGMIKLEDGSTIIAVERNGGAFYKVNDGSFERLRYGENGGWVGTGKYATGALALWTDDDTPGARKKIIVAGIQGGLYNTISSSYTYGYVEFDLKTDGSGSIDLSESQSRRDPGSLRSVHDNDRYRSTIGKEPINHLFQAPISIDQNMTFFASTQNSGLWSYRERPNSGGWQWNAEN
ncbi:MAG: hypothetical protein LBQ69_00695 [Treponema sp.]|nr:hypothetical protein [Treponema sp.]